MSYADLKGVPSVVQGVTPVEASQWNTYVKDNFDSLKAGHIVCTSSTRPSPLVAGDEGLMIFETDTDKFLVWDGSGWVEINDLDNTGALPDSVNGLNNFFGAWTSHTPTWNLTVGDGLNVGRYLKVGRTVIFAGKLTWGSTTTASGSQTLVTLPFPAANVSDMCWIGSAYLQDGLSLIISGTCVIDTSSLGGNTLMGFYKDYGSVALAGVNNVNPWTWASGDVLSWTITYEADA